MSDADFTDLVLDPNKPLQYQLYKTLVNWIIEGRLTAGVRLPSSRRLADSVGVSRNTVTLAIEQLRAEGFVISQAGKGVFVSTDLPAFVKSPNPIKWKSDSLAGLPPLSQFGKRLLNWPKSQSPVPDSLPFSPGVPDLNAFPATLWSSVYRRHLGRKALMGYGHG